MSSNTITPDPVTPEQLENRNRILSDQLERQEQIINRLRAELKVWQGRLVDERAGHEETKATLDILRIVCTPIAEYVAVLDPAMRDEVNMTNGLRHPTARLSLGQLRAITYVVADAVEDS